MANKKLDNDHYEHVTPLRLTERQDAEVRDLARRQGITVTQLLRDALVEQLEISKGPAAKRVLA